MRQILRLARNYFRENSLETFLRQLGNRDAPATVQFAKYSICGLIALITHLTITYTLGLTLLPAIDPSLTPGVRARNSMINNSIAFLLSNLVAYLLNARFVFTSGRHSRRKEVSLFYGVSGISFFFGLAAIPVIILQLRLNSHLANGAFVLTSALLNYVCRKFFIFQR